MLIGINCIKVIKLCEVIFGGDNDLYGFKIDFGWGIVGRVCKFLDEDFEELLKSWVNKIVINEDVIFVVEFRVKEIISLVYVNEMFERDFYERVEYEFFYFVC